MPPCVHHRFSRLPIARIHLSHRSPELISAFASVRPSARSLHDDSCTLPTIPSLLPPEPSLLYRSLFLFSPHPPGYPSRDPTPSSKRPSPPPPPPPPLLRFSVSSIVDATRLERPVEGRVERKADLANAAIRRLLDLCLLIFGHVDRRFPYSKVLLS